MRRTRFPSLAAAAAGLPSQCLGGVCASSSVLLLFVSFAHDFLLILDSHSSSNILANSPLSFQCAADRIPSS